ncbi:MAG: hypothetical protein HY519_03780 [Candidatus Aenigmarchaeota archaeon]|nr:hypothetical protein [Candidatus Aenigmarchaeota archaeon]
MLIRKLAVLAGSLLLGALISFLAGGVGLAAIYVIMWFDKVILGFAGIVRWIGIDFTTIATVMLGMAFGPWFAFFYTIIVIPVFHAVKFIALPLYEPEWPLFIPHYYNFIDAIGAALAGMFAWSGIFWAAIVVMFARMILYSMVDYYLLEKGVNVFIIPQNFIFNLLLVWYYGKFFAGLAGIT